MQHFTIILGLTACYFMVILGFVLYARLKETKKLLPGLNEFFLAGKNLSTLVLTFTVAGSLFSTFTVLGLPALIYGHGIGALILYLSFYIIGIPLFFVIGKKLHHSIKGKRIFSPIEAISSNYKSRKLGLFMAVILAIFLVPYISLQLVGVGAFINAYTDGAINYTLGVGSMMFIVFIYLFLGGMRAVAYTDFVQISASFIGLILGLTLLLNNFELPAFSIINKIHEISPDHLSLPGPKGLYTVPFLISITIVSLGIFIQPHLLTRTMMAKNDSQIMYMSIGTLLASFLAALLATYFAFTALITYGPDLQANFLMGHIFKEIGTWGTLGLIISALMLMGALGAAMSTADSLLISIGQITTRDMVRPFFQITPERQVILSKVIMISVLIAAFITGLKPPQFMTDLAFYSAAGSALMLPTIISFTWKRRSTIAAYLSISLGLVALLAAVFYKIKTGNNIAGLHIGTLPVLASFVIYYGVCFTRR